MMRNRAPTSLEPLEGVSVSHADGSPSYELHRASPREISVLTDEPPPLRQLIPLSITFDDEDRDPLSLLGYVIRRHLSETSDSEKPPGMGLRLASAERRGLRRWREFVESHTDSTRVPTIHVTWPSSRPLEPLLELESNSVSHVVRYAPELEVGSSVICRLSHPNRDATIQLRADVLDAVERSPRGRGLELQFRPVEGSTLEALESFVRDEPSQQEA